MFISLTWISIHILCYSVLVGWLPPYPKDCLYTIFPNPDPLPHEISPRKLWAQSAERKKMGPETNRWFCVFVFFFFITSYYFQFKPIGVKRMSGLEKSLETI